jgi:hypothetical protein
MNRGTYDVELVTPQNKSNAVILQPHLFQFDGYTLISLYQTIGEKLVSLKFMIWTPQLFFCGSFANKHSGK